MIVDLSLVEPFNRVWDSIDDWQRDPKRDLKDLPTIVGRVPTLEDVVIDGRSMLDLYKGSTTYTEEDELEDILQAGVRTALEYRLDVMNQRAQLYDAWRQIRFRANALKGILNVGITNQVLTPPTTTNPFGFFSPGEPVQPRPERRTAVDPARGAQPTSEARSSRTSVSTEKPAEHRGLTEGPAQAGHPSVAGRLDHLCRSPSRTLS